MKVTIENYNNLGPFNEEQREFIEKCLLDNQNVSKILDPKLSVQKMRLKMIHEQVKVLKQQNQKLHQELVNQKLYQELIRSNNESNKR